MRARTGAKDGLSDRLEDGNGEEHRHDDGEETGVVAEFLPDGEGHWGGL
jgi:hypothetical protein